MLSRYAPFKEFTSILNPHLRRIVTGISLSAIGGGMTLSLMMVYLHDIRGFTTTFGGLLLAWGAFVGILGTGPTGASVDRIGPKKVIVPGLVLASLAAFSFSLVTTHAHAVIAMTLFSIGGQCIWPARVNTSLKRMNRGRVAIENFLPVKISLSSP